MGKFVFDPKKQYGSFVELGEPITDEMLADIKQVFAERIGDVVPDAYRGNVVIKANDPDDIYPFGTVSWKYSP